MEATITSNTDQPPREMRMIGSASTVGPQEGQFVAVFDELTRQWADYRQSAEQPRRPKRAELRLVADNPPAPVPSCESRPAEQNSFLEDVALLRRLVQADIAAEKKAAREKAQSDELDRLLDLTLAKLGVKTVIDYRTGKPFQRGRCAKEARKTPQLRLIEGGTLAQATAAGGAP